MERITRRQFMAKSGRMALGLGVSSMIAPAKGQTAQDQSRIQGANERILVGCIGVGGMGTDDIRSFMQEADVEIVAVCDVDSERLDSATKLVEEKQGRKPQAFHDYRKLLEMKQIDAVIIATPDHWHALQMINAAEAGKDIFLEKPISHNIVEAKSMVAAAKRFKSVVQCDTWQRSVQHFVDANAFLHAGKLGQISVCRAWTLGSAKVGRVKPTAAPPTLDWDFWIGPAKWEPYRSDIAPWNWRWYFSYGAGLTGDWGAHMLDTVLQGMQDWHPLEVCSYGGKLVCGETDDRTTPDTQIAIFKFANWVLHWEIHVGPPGLDGGGDHGAEFIGKNGSLIVDRNGLKFTPRPKHEQDGPTTVQVVKDNHVRNFLSCMKTRGLPRSDVFSMAHSNSLCHLANLSYLLGRSIEWDGERQEVVGDRQAEQLSSYRREYRHPWSLPRYDAISNQPTGT